MRTLKTLARKGNANPEALRFFTQLDKLLAVVEQYDVQGSPHGSMPRPPRTR